MKKRIVIVGNGTLSKKYLGMIKPQDYVIGVDRAAYWLIREGRCPDVAIGDFDSVTKEEFGEIKKSVPTTKQFPKDKDQTDMELAFAHAIKKRPTEVLILGGTGSRLDHTLATWYLLDLLWEAHIPHMLVDEKNRVRLVGRGRTILAPGGEYKYMSILPYTKTVTLALSGFRYNASKTTIMRGTTRGISNEIVERQAEIIIYSGKAWVIESND
jgi:thiamine pyrophosphokinase